MFYFDCTVKHKANENDSKTRKFHYLLRAVSYSDAEAQCYKIAEMNSVRDSFSIDTIKKTDVTEYNSVSEEGEKFYSAIVNILQPDDDGENTSVDKYHHIIRADDIAEIIPFVNRLYNSQDIAIQQVKKTNIYEVYENISTESSSNAESQECNLI